VVVLLVLALMLVLVVFVIVVGGAGGGGGWRIVVFGLAICNQLLNCNTPYHIRQLRVNCLQVVDGEGVLPVAHVPNNTNNHGHAHAHTHTHTRTQGHTHAQTHMSPTQPEPVRLSCDCCDSDTRGGPGNAIQPSSTSAQTPRASLGAHTRLDAARSDSRVVIGVSV
jgi:hypothetical protein